MITAVTIGTSAGGFSALNLMIPALPLNFDKSIIIVHHSRPTSQNSLIDHLDKQSKIIVKEAEDKELIMQGKVYIAPLSYHLLIEDDRRFSLSNEPAVNHSRPSIDVLFESAADVYEDNLAGIILTGASSDGANGLRAIKNSGGLTIVEDPDTASSPFMPRSAIKATPVDFIFTIPQIIKFLAELPAAEPVHQPQQRFGN